MKHLVLSQVLVRRDRYGASVGLETDAPKRSRSSLTTPGKTARLTAHESCVASSNFSRSFPTRAISPRLLIAKTEFLGKIANFIILIGGYTAPVGLTDFSLSSGMGGPPVARKHNIQSPRPVPVWLGFLLWMRD